MNVRVPAHHFGAAHNHHVTLPITIIHSRPLNLIKLSDHYYNVSINSIMYSILNFPFNDVPHSLMYSFGHWGQQASYTAIVLPHFLGLECFLFVIDWTCDTYFQLSYYTNYRTERIYHLRCRRARGWDRETKPGQARPGQTSHAFGCRSMKYFSFIVLVCPCSCIEHQGWSAIITLFLFYC